MFTLDSLKSRLTDPGSIRSLVFTIFMFKGVGVDDALVNDITNAVLGVIGLVSFFMKPKAVVAVVPATQMQDAAATVDAAADKLKDVLGTTR